ncbi:hypothetical protein P5673_017976 [Acropora cervicornis]|uniref:Uncharacterized protein n=1 Tax=Acropora cervicornis TaxID=6130 RepID=A0AAD9QDN4_ACRCE|nr:hypothetical protein P5673_017976 [Acropora cervicornis]
MYNDIGLLYSVTESIPDNARVLSFIFLTNIGQNQFTLYFTLDILFGSEICKFVYKPTLVKGRLSSEKFGQSIV